MAKLLTDSSVKVRATIHQILEVDLREETFTAEVDVFMRWVDPRLANWRTRVWLHRSNPPRLATSCAERGACVCGWGQQGSCSKLPFVEGCFEERGGRHYISVGREEPWELETFSYKEEPAFEHFDQLEAMSSTLVLSKLVEEATLLARHLRLSNGRTGEVVLFRKLLAKFKENMELLRFPFDRQLLQFSLTAAVPSNALTLEAEEEPKSSCKIKHLPEYEVDQGRIDDVGIAEARLTGNPTGQKKYWQVRFAIPVERNPGKYMVNIGLMLWILVVASFSNFTVRVDAPADRMAIIVTFILTSMAMKYLINDQLPGKSYQTWLDLYLLASYVFLSLPALWVIGLWVWFGDLTKLDDVDLQGVEGAEWWLARILFVVWTLFHLFIFTLPCFSYRCVREDWEQVLEHQQEHDPWQLRWPCPRPCSCYKDLESSDSEGDSR
ncbi:GABRB4 [Symbiodinium natans]|uniref:GABRB4 protein n=1 Tax=Symbiodinium natans TaxID=878477 RepID=A0A812KKM7_9DINO|nr:GABRB4 [Symbiodinium natans]